jgi:tetratricopeptide (TPR) repeat protein
MALAATHYARRMTVGLPKPTPLQAAALDTLRRKGALTLDGLADALEAEGIDLGEHRLENLDDALLERDEIWDLPDGRLVHAEAVLEGVAFARRLTPEELATGTVDLEADLLLLTLSPGRTFPLDGGGAATLDLVGSDRATGELGRWTMSGPPGWLEGLRPDVPTAFRLVDGVLHVEEVTALLDIEEVADALGDTFDTHSFDEPVETAPLLLAFIVEHPDLRGRPLPPLSEVVSTAGLETRGDWTGEAGIDWDSLGGDLSHDLDEVGQEALQVLLAGFTVAAAEEGGFNRLAEEAELSAQLGAVLSFEGVAEAFVLETMGPDAGPDDWERVRAWTSAIAAHAAGQPAPHWVLAVAAERRGDTEAAERHLRAALAADPGFYPALLDAAWNAEDRGEAVRALSLLRRAGVDDDDSQVARLEHYARPGPAAASRNAPCPCGSGRKYKVCCAQRNGYSLADRVPWLLAKLDEFVQRAGRRSLVVEVAVARTDGDFGDGAWVRAALGDELVADLALFEGGVIEQFCDERGPLLPADELELARSWIGRRLRLYEVIATHAGSGAEVKELSSGEHATVNDPAASTQLRRGTLLLARLLPVGAGWRLSPATMDVPSELRDPLRTFLDEDPDAVEIAAWIAAAEQPRAVETTDGDPLVRCELRLRVPDPAATARALDGALERDLDHWVAHEVRNGARLLLGAVHLVGDELQVTAASEPRFDALVDLVREAIGHAKVIDEQRTPT